MKEITVPKKRGITVLSVDETVYARMNEQHLEMQRKARADLREKDRRDIRGLFCRDRFGWGRLLREARS
jgi:hypothetical protein